MLRTAKNVERISIQLASTHLLMHDFKVLLDCSITADQAFPLATKSSLPKAPIMFLHSFSYHQSLRGPLY